MSSRGRRLIGDASGRLMRSVLLIASALLVLSFASTSHAYPWMIRHGFAKCASCHTDPMGGETLAGFGRVMSDTTVFTRWGETEPSSKAELFFGVEEPRDLRVGGSIRYMDFLYKLTRNGQSSKPTTFPMQVDAYGQLTLFSKLRIGGSLGASKVRTGSTYSQAAQVTKNPPGEYNLLSRSHWVGFEVTDEILVRAGRLNLPFGMRIPEHVMWVRTATRTDRESEEQHGAAVAYSAGRWRGELMGIAGNFQVSPDKFRERGYSLYAEYLLAPRTAVGVSSLITHATDDRITLTPLTRQAHGLTGRLAPIAPLAILAEADVLLSDQSQAGYAGMLQADYELAQGFHALLTGEILDAGKPNGGSSTPGFGEPKLGGWITHGGFFFSHFVARVSLFPRRGEAATIQSQIHYYF